MTARRFSIAVFEQVGGHARMFRSAYGDPRSLAVRRLAAARIARSLRFVPYSTEPSYVRLYRRAGIAIALLGIAAVVR